MKQPARATGRSRFERFADAATFALGTVAVLRGGKRGDGAPTPVQAGAAGDSPESDPTRSPAEAHARSREPGRGREALAPTQIPWAGWKDILTRVWKEIDDDRVLAVAAGMVFYGLLAIFPAIAALVSLYGLVADPSTISSNLNAAAGVLPSGGVQILEEQVKRVVEQGNDTLGLALIFSLALSLWSANSGVKALFDSLNVVYDEKEKRGFVKLTLFSLTFTLGAILFIILAFLSVVVLQILLDFVGLGQVLEWVLAIARWPLLLLVMVGGLMVVYRYGPSRDRPRWNWLWPGAVMAAVLWLAGSLALSYYLSNFEDYSKTYGSLGAAMGFMMWLWLSTTVILVGAELNAEIEHQTAKDTTKGPEKPLGGRGATMADSVGPAQG